MKHTFHDEMKPIELRSMKFSKEAPFLGLVTAGEAERILGLRKEDLSYSRVRGFGLPYFKIGRPVRYCLADIDVYKSKIDASAPSREYAENPFSDLVGRGLIVEPRTASRILTLSHKHLSELRSYGGGPRFLRFGHYVRYAVDELIIWLIAGRTIHSLHREIRRPLR
ncbi:hypothetical protein [Novosphingobium sp. 11B]